MNYAKFKKFIFKQSCLKKSCINLLASENVASEAMLSILGSDLNNRYNLSDFPNIKYVKKIIRELEKALCKLFSSNYADCTPLSGMNCMELIFSSLSNPNDNIYIIPPSLGGHASTQHNCTILGRNAIYLPINSTSLQFDKEKIERIFKKFHPKLIYLDYTLICFYTNPEELIRIAHQYNALVVYDASHVLGLIAGKTFPNPLESGVDCLCGSTHKTFPGPQKAIFLTNNEFIHKHIKKVGYDFISSVHLNNVLALYVATIEMQKYGNTYAKQIIENSKALGERLSQRGICIPTYEQGISQTHQVWIKIASPQLIYESLAKFGINTNCMRIPGVNGLGLRLGTAEVTRLGMKEQEMYIIADLIADIIQNNTQTARSSIISLTKRFSHVLYSIDDEQRTKMIKSQKYTFHNSVNFKFDNIIADYENKILRPLQYYCGIILRGGLGRGIFDKLSDIDFTCIFNVEDVETYRKTLGLKRGMFRYNGVMFSARYISLTEFIQGKWSDKMKHAYQFSKTINCNPLIINTIKDKTSMSLTEKRKKIIDNIINLGEMCKIYPKLGDFEMYSEIYKQYHRHEYVAAHSTIDLALKYVKNIIFTLNGIYYPEEKSYYIEYFSNLAVQPAKIDESINEILLAPRTPYTIATRLNKLRDLSRELIKFVNSQIELPNNIYNEIMNN